jgi:hypothetical protein
LGGAAAPGRPPLPGRSPGARAEVCSDLAAPGTGRHVELRRSGADGCHQWPSATAHPERPAARPRSEACPRGPGRGARHPAAWDRF